MKHGVRCIEHLYFSDNSFITCALVFCSNVKSSFWIALDLFFLRETLIFSVLESEDELFSGISYIIINKY
jgi:hypothetical protein